MRLFFVKDFLDFNFAKLWAVWTGDTFDGENSLCFYSVVRDASRHKVSSPSMDNDLTDKLEA